MTTLTTTLVLRFDASSDYSGMFVDLDHASGGYPVAVESPLQAKFWNSEKEALDYAKHFPPPPEAKSYAAYAIEPKAHRLIATVES